MATIPSTTARFAGSDFRIGSVINRAFSVLSRNLLKFSAVTAVAYLPTLLLTKVFTDGDNVSGIGVLTGFLGILLLLAFSMVSHAIITFAAFQDMRGRPVHLGESLGIGLQRVVPIIGLAIVIAIAIGLGFMALIIPGLILLTMWFIAIPACVVEQLGPLASLKRSAQLTKGHRWKIFGLMLLLLLISIVVTPIIDLGLASIGGPMLALIVGLIWNALWGAFYGIAVVVSYHDLRVAKEGIDTEQIAAVFD